MIFSSAFSEIAFSYFLIKWWKFSAWKSLPPSKEMSPENVKICE
jgi:hypothetical protein